MCFFYLELDLIRDFTRKLDLGKPHLYEKIHLKKIERHRGNKEKCILMLRFCSIFVKFAFCVILKLSSLAEIHRNDISKASTVKLKLSDTLKKLCGFCNFIFARPAVRAELVLTTLRGVVRVNWDYQ